MRYCQDILGYSFELAFLQQQIRFNAASAFYLTWTQWPAMVWSSNKWSKQHLSFGKGSMSFVTLPNKMCLCITVYRSENKAPCCYKGTSDHYHFERSILKLEGTFIEHTIQRLHFLNRKPKTQSNWLSYDIRNSWQSINWNPAFLPWVFSTLPTTLQMTRRGRQAAEWSSLASYS